MKDLKLIFVLTLVFVMFSGFTFSNNDDKKRAERISDSKKALKLLYAEEPGTREAIKSAYGYATFRNYGMSMMISFEGGTGLARNNTTGKITYMNMAAAGMGIGMGAKEFMAVFIFDNKEVFDKFIDDGWEANAQADAAMQAEDDGDSVSKVDTIEKGVKLYKITKNGIAMQMTIQGSRYWKCRDLN